jgi:signal peptidase I
VHNGVPHRGRRRGAVSPGHPGRLSPRERLIKRYIAGPGQTVVETETGIAIDGTALATEPVDSGFRYSDASEGRVSERTGTVVREHLGARGYLTLRTGPPRQPGTWTVPAGHLFFLGDNRDNSYDSRFTGGSRRDGVVGRVVGIWLAWHDGVPDWERIGMPVD